MAICLSQRASNNMEVSIGRWEARFIVSNLQLFCFFAHVDYLSKSLCCIIISICSCIVNPPALLFVWLKLYYLDQQFSIHFNIACVVFNRPASWSMTTTFTQCFIFNWPESWCLPLYISSSFFFLINLQSAEAAYFHACPCNSTMTNRASHVLYGLCKYFNVANWWLCHGALSIWSISGSNCMH